MTLRLLKLFDRVLQLLVPADAARICWISDPDYVGNAHHLYRHVLTARSGFEHVWLVTDRGASKRIRADFERWGAAQRGHRLRVLRRHTAAGYVAYLRSRWVFHTCGVYRWVASAVGRDCVSLWHGMPIKAIGALNTVTPNPYPTYGTLHLATSDFYRYLMAQAFCATTDEVLLTGLPRCDVLHGARPLTTDADQLRAVLGVPPTDRLVLWLPTYRTMRGRRGTGATGGAAARGFLDDLTVEQLHRLDEAAAAAEATVVVKPHPYDPFNDVDHDLGLCHVRVVRSPEWLATGVELYDALAFADGLVTDISSVLIDWLTTTRPLGMVGFHPDRYTRDVLFDVSVLRTSPRIQDLADPDQLAVFFDRVANGTPVPSEEDDLSAWLYHPDLVEGCERVLAEVGLSHGGTRG